MSPQNFGERDIHQARGIGSGGQNNRNRRNPGNGNEIAQNLREAKELVALGGYLGHKQGYNRDR